MAQRSDIARGRGSSGGTVHDEIDGEQGQVIGHANPVIAFEPDVTTRGHTHDRKIAKARCPVGQCRADVSPDDQWGQVT
jgi:hypothetical protein